MELIPENIIAYFQPILSVDRKIIYAYEVLGRYIDKDGNALSLGSFFSSPDTSYEEARHVDLIVWRYAMRRYAQEQHGEYLFVNIRLQGLIPYLGIQEELPVIRYAKEVGIAPEKLVVEITEYEFNTDSEAFLEVVRLYKKAGCRIAIDDYGKGASDINRLAKIMPDIVKIDMDYIHKSENSYLYREHLRSLAHYAERIGIDVIYEGVETQEQLNICMTSGGRYYQGYLFAKPQSSIRNIRADTLVFSSACEYVFRILREKAYQANILSGFFDAYIESFFLGPDSAVPKDICASLSAFCLHLPAAVQRVYFCNRQGEQLSCIFERHDEEMEGLEYGSMSLVWRGYFQEILSAFERGRKSYLSSEYRDIITKVRTFTYARVIHDNLFLLIDILRVPFHNREGTDGPYTVYDFLAAFKTPFSPS